MKRLNSFCFWVRPLKPEVFSQMIELGTIVNEGPIRRLDHWTKVLSPKLKPCCIQLVGIPLHSWDVSVFKCLVEMFGFDRVCLLILCDPQRSLPSTLSLEVEGAGFFVFV